MTTIKIMCSGEKSKKEIKARIYANLINVKHNGI